MTDLKIIATSGGRNFELAKRIEKIAIKLDIESTILELDDYAMPLYTRGTKDASFEALPKLAGDLDGTAPWILLLPEYNGGLPPVWINSLTWLSVHYDDFRALFNRRKVAVGTASGGHGWKALAAMREQFAHLGSDVVGRYLRDAKNSPASEDSIIDTLRRLGL